MNIFVIGVQLSSSQYSHLRTIAISCARNGTDNGYGIVLLYNAIWNNCGDFILNLLKNKVKINLVCNEEYQSTAEAYIRKTNIKPLLDHLDKGKARWIANDKTPATVPNALYDTFQKFTGSAYDSGNKMFLD